MKFLIKNTFLVSLSIFFFSTTYAHNIGGNGLESGITHPIFGLDHLLAMIAVGILGSQTNKKSIWKLPLCFVSFMILGGLLGINNLQIPLIETGVAFSVLILGLMIFAKKTPFFISSIIVSFFAIFHGYAHGMEIPQITHPSLYILGFVLSTTTLHISGVLIGRLAQRTTLTTITLKYSGIAISMVGIYFLLSL